MGGCLSARSALPAQLAAARPVALANNWVRQPLDPAPPLPAVADTWTCPVCTLRNARQVQRCLVCSHEAGSPLASTADIRVDKEYYRARGQDRAGPGSRAAIWWPAAPEAPADYTLVICCYRGKVKQEARTLVPYSSTAAFWLPAESKELVWAVDLAEAAFPVPDQLPEPSKGRAVTYQLELLLRKPGEGDDKQDVQVVAATSAPFRLKSHAAGRRHRKTLSAPPLSLPAGPACVVCLENPREQLLIPCRHACVCSHCAAVLQALPMGCPLCRASIVSSLKIYL